MDGSDKVQAVVVATLGAVALCLIAAVFISDAFAGERRAKIAIACIEAGGSVRFADGRLSECTVPKGVQ